ncbi:MAG: hypothetical protein ALECFALPRED_006464 [Alectoria fallacina]|uniref:Uncharacterized protein n=1 Tax=Alectoria fallacina TaxID=1903189 RepID=A0A8H3ERG4_9LECA|nr:MAG: hypothetical protein ALECFALPRED_006464 [Alectoria fallacina]
MGPTALRSQPTIHNGALHTMYQSQQPNRPPPPSSNEPHIASNLTAPDDDRPHSPVSPLDSNGGTWSYPRRANTPLQGLGTLYEVPLDEPPIRPRPMSYYDGMPTSPEPDPKAVFADLPAAPAKKRLSRPFEQPYAIDDRGLRPPPPPPGQGQAPAPPPAAAAAAVVVVVPPTHDADVTRAGAHPGRQAVQHGHRKAAPAPLAIPTPAHQPRRQREGSPYLEDQAPAQRPVRHQGWNPLEEPPRQQRTAHAQHQDRRRGDDLEWQAGLARSKQRSKHDDPQYKSGRSYFFSIVIMMVVFVVIIVVTVIRNERHG